MFDHRGFGLGPRLLSRINQCDADKILKIGRFPRTGLQRVPVANHRRLYSIAAYLNLYNILTCARGTDRGRARPSESRKFLREKRTKNRVDSTRFHHSYIYPDTRAFSSIRIGLRVNIGIPGRRLFCEAVQAKQYGLKISSRVRIVRNNLFGRFVEVGCKKKKKTKKQ